MQILTFNLCFSVITWYIKCFGYKETITWHLAFDRCQQSMQIIYLISSYSLRMVFIIALSATAKWNNNSYSYIWILGKEVCFHHGLRHCFSLLQSGGFTILVKVRKWRLSMHIKRKNDGKHCSFLGKLWVRGVCMRALLILWGF